jgi:hypothetical protein
MEIQMTDETNPTPPAKSKKELVLTGLENIENKLKGLFGGVHDEVAVIIAEIRGHLG